MSEWIISTEDIDDITGGGFTVGQKLVRCKDCRFHEQEQPGMVYCPATVGGWVEENWFCKGGERREDGNTTGSD